MRLHIKRKREDTRKHAAAAQSVREIQKPQRKHAEYPRRLSPIMQLGITSKLRPTRWKGTKTQWSSTSRRPAFRPEYWERILVFLCVEKATGYSVSSRRILRATQLKEGFMAIYQAPLSDSESAITQALGARNSGESVSSQSVLRPRGIVEEVEFARGATDLGALMGRFLTRSYWADSFAVQKIQVPTNANAFVISSGGGDGYVITHVVPP